jgi:predicted chitinase
MELYENTKLCSMPIWIPLRIAHFMGQAQAESGLKSVRESCY